MVWGGWQTLGEGEPDAWARGANGGERGVSMTVTDKTVVALDDDEQEEAARVAYARAVGSRLRAMRKQMRLSLQAVEAMSDQEFKASVLGAYERGERAISVPRLQRLAKLYDVPVDQLLPNDDAAGRRTLGAPRRRTTGRRPDGGRRCRRACRTRWPST